MIRNHRNKKNQKRNKTIPKKKATLQNLKASGQSPRGEMLLLNGSWQQKRQSHTSGKCVLRSLPLELKPDHQISCRSWKPCPKYIAAIKPTSKTTLTTWSSKALYSIGSPDMPHVWRDLVIRLGIGPLGGRQQKAARRNATWRTIVSAKLSKSGRHWEEGAGGTHT